LVSKTKKDKRGYLISIEGPDAAGKQTQSLLLNSWLQHKNFNVKLLEFPDYTTPIGKEIKAFLLDKRQYSVEFKHLLFAANRWEKLDELKNLLNIYKILIINRYTESNLVYGQANGLKLNWLINLEKGLPKSDLTIVLDAPPSILQERRKIQKDSYESDVELQKRVQHIYKELARKFGWVIISAVGQVEVIHKSIIELVRKTLQLNNL
jgi:dTMP kinase